MGVRVASIPEPALSQFPSEPPLQLPSTMNATSLPLSLSTGIGPSFSRCRCRFHPSTPNAESAGTKAQDVALTSSGPSSELTGAIPREKARQERTELHAPPEPRILAVRRLAQSREHLSKDCKGNQGVMAGIWRKPQRESVIKRERSSDQRETESQGKAFWLDTGGSGKGTRCEPSNTSVGKC